MDPHVVGNKSPTHATEDPGADRQFLEGKAGGLRLGPLDAVEIGQQLP
jgi:hypothetical protein